MKYLFLDVDGTLTDGKIYIGNQGELMKAFSVHDGYALGTLCKNAGITPVIITGRNSEIVKQRCEELGITEIYQGYQEKLPTMRKIMGDTDPAQCGYIGDDIPDLPCMEYLKNAGGVTACPADAVKEIIQSVDYVCEHNGGSGAVREFVEWIISQTEEII